MKQTIDVEIDGHTYRIGQLGGRSGLACALPATRLLAPLAAAGAALVAGRVADAAKALGDAKTEDLEHLSRELENVTLLLVPAIGAKAGAAPLARNLREVSDAHFAGRIASQIRFLRAAFEHNFSDFLADLAPSAQAGSVTERPAPEEP